jgi:hypothetical protein
LDSCAWRCRAQGTPGWNTPPQPGDGTLHLCSVADILLGAFRYCVNEPENEEAGKAMFPTLMEMMWKRTHAGQTYVNEGGLVFRPQEVQVAKYKAEYDGLATRLQGYLDWKKSEGTAT